MPSHTLSLKILCTCILVYTPTYSRHNCVTDMMNNEDFGKTTVPGEGGGEGDIEL